MSSDLTDFRGEFLDDFYAECDELLGNIRTYLTQLEEATGGARSDPAALEALFRNVHSFKGICGIVGLREAEELAHNAENLLRLLSRGATMPAMEQLDLLAQVFHRFELIATAHRRQQLLPEIGDLLAQLKPYSASSPPAPSAAPAPAKDDAPAPAPKLKLNPGQMLWQATFSPSTELDQRGVNINRVRARLTALGDILSATPAIRPGGIMNFEFMVAVRGTPDDLAAWKADGILLRPAETPARPPNAPEGSGGTADAEASSMFVAPSHIVRVDLSRLDDLMRIVGELVIHRSRLDERITRAGGDRSGLQEVNLSLTRSLRELREAITRMRLVPVAEIFGRLPFVVRDLARESEKKVRLRIDGQDTEIDKHLVERLKEPLLHLVRNAISHGVESPEERIRHGKPEEATLTLRAATSGQSVVIQIRDDGRGIDAKKIIARAASQGIALPETPTASELLSVISRSGFSTRDEADRASGRGVGMDVVHRVVRELGGTLALESEPGQGTQFTLRLPLTLSIAETFLVTAAGQTCAVPQGFVDEIIEVRPADVRQIQQTEVAPYRDGVLPLSHLRALFGAEPATAPQSPVLVLNSERGLCGLVVDRVIGQREVVVRAMQDPLIQVSGVSGATELGDGRPVLILDPVAFASGAIRPRARVATAPTAHISTAH